MNMTIFSKDNVFEFIRKEEFFPFKKVGETLMVRIHSPFSVRTREGLMYCEDGWLALDADGNPYPIAADVQLRTYELA